MSRAYFANASLGVSRASASTCSRSETPTAPPRVEEGSREKPPRDVPRDASPVVRCSFFETFFENDAAASADAPPAPAPAPPSDAPLASPFPFPTPNRNATSPTPSPVSR